MTVDTICQPILIYHLEPAFKQYPEDTKKKEIFFNELKQFYTAKVVYIKSIINTKSNVNFKVLNKLLDQFNLEKIPEYPEPRYSLSVELDKLLLKIRNAVAHGDNAIIVNCSNLVRAITLVNKLMELVFERIISGFTNKI